MGRRLIAAAAALVLAIMGALVLVAYARGADARAMAGLTTRRVLLVAQPIAAGTAADALPELVRTKELPAAAVVPGAVGSLGELAGKVATVDLKPGEQLLAARFAAPSALRAPGTVAVPAGDEEISVQLDSQRAVGGRLAAGDTVGVFVSLVDTKQTSAVLHHVLVSQVQGAAPAPDAGRTGTSTAAATTAPTGQVTVTLALSAKDAEVVVFGQEHGTVWLSLEPADADTRGTTVLDPTNVYTEAY